MLFFCTLTKQNFIWHCYFLSAPQLAAVRFVYFFHFKVFFWLSPILAQFLLSGSRIFKVLLLLGTGFKRALGRAGLHPELWSKCYRPQFANKEPRR